MKNNSNYIVTNIGKIKYDVIMKQIDISLAYEKKKKKKDLVLLNNCLIFKCRVDIKSTLLCYNYIC